MFRVVVFAVVTMTLGVSNEFDAHVLPVMVRLAPPAAVLIPSGPGTLVRFMVVELDPVT